MNIYTKALTPAERVASRVVDVLLDRLRNVGEGSAGSTAGEPAHRVFAPIR